MCSMRTHNDKERDGCAQPISHLKASVAYVIFIKTVADTNIGQQSEGILGPFCNCKGQHVNFASMKESRIFTELEDQVGVLELNTAEHVSVLPLSTLPPSFLQSGRLEKSFFLVFIQAPTM